MKVRDLPSGNSYSLGRDLTRDLNVVDKGGHGRGWFAGLMRTGEQRFKAYCKAPHQNIVTATLYFGDFHRSAWLYHFLAVPINNSRSHP